MNDCWDCIHLEKRCGGFQYCIRYGKRNVDANRARCRDYQKEQQLKEMTNQTPCNHRTPPKYNVEYLDDKMVIVNGVQYQKVEKPKPQTLYDTFREKHGDYPMSRYDASNIVRDWLIDHTVIEAEDAEKVTFTIHKEQL